MTDAEFEAKRRQLRLELVAEAFPTRKRRSRRMKGKREVASVGRTGRPRSVWVRKDGSPSEAAEARTFTQWARAQRLEFARIPNEGATVSGSMAAILIATGLWRGAPDTLIFDHPPLASRHYCGVAIELKAKGGKATPEQEKALEVLRARGWFAVVCVGAKEAIEVCETLGLTRTGLAKART